MPERDDAVHRQSVPDGNPPLVCVRLVRTDDLSSHALLECFKSNRALGKPPRGRERRQPLIHRGLSVYKAIEQAAGMRRRIAASLRPGEVPRIGEHAATLEVRGPDMLYEDRNEINGHMTIWAAPSRCAEAVVDIQRLDN